MEGKTIRAWRESKGLSRTELADLCNSSPATVANWELNRNQPHGAALDKLQKLMSGEVSVTPLTPQEDRLLDELVKRGGFANREAFLTSVLVERLKSGAIDVTHTPTKPKRGAKQ